MNNLVSVIITIHKDENLLRSCLDSIITQTYDKLEIILVADGSSDACLDICDDYARRDSRIKVINNLKGGTLQSKNLGLEIMTGEYVYFLDGADYVENNLIEVTLWSALDKSVDLVVTNYNKIDEYNNLLSPIRLVSAIDDLNDHNRISYIINKLENDRSDGWLIGNKLFKADIIRDNNISFWELIYSEEIGFLLNYLLFVCRISYIEDSLYYYRIIKDSVRADPKTEPRIREAIILCKLIENMIVSSFKDTKINKRYSILLFALIKEQLAKLHAYNYKEVLSSLGEISSTENIYPMEDMKYFYSRIRLVIRKPLLLLRFYGLLMGSALLWQSIFISSRKAKRAGIFVIHMINKFEKISKAYKHNRGKLLRKKRIFLIGCEDFWNLGDHHIGISEIEYLEKKFPDHVIIEITASNYFSVNRILPLIIRRRNLIFLHGGGNMGNFYMLAEYIRRDIMKKFPKNEKVIFPQTIHYDDSVEGISVLKEDQKIISKTKNLTLCVREEYSYKLAKDYFDCPIVLSPDIVLYSDYSDRYRLEREGAVLLLRNDLERITSDQDKHSIINLLKLYTSRISINDTQLIIDINVDDRRVVMDDFISKIAGAQIVVTDRLHGMVFCAITATPCIVLPNYNHKVEGVYNWVSELEYIIMIKDMSQFEEAVKRLLKVEGIIYDNSNIVDKFEDLTKLIKSKVN